MEAVTAVNGRGPGAVGVAAARPAADADPPSAPGGAGALADAFQGPEWVYDFEIASALALSAEAPSVIAPQLHDTDALRSAAGLAASSPRVRGATLICIAFAGCCSIRMCISRVGRVRPIQTMLRARAGGAGARGFSRGGVAASGASATATRIFPCRLAVITCVPLTCVVITCVPLTCVVVTCVPLSCVVITCVPLTCVVITCVPLTCVVFTCVPITCVVITCVPLTCVVITYVPLTCVVIRYVPLTCVVNTCVPLTCVGERMGNLGKFAVSGASCVVIVALYCFVLVVFGRKRDC